MVLISCVVIRTVCPERRTLLSWAPRLGERGAIIHQMGVARFLLRATWLPVLRRLRLSLWRAVYLNSTYHE